MKVKLKWYKNNHRVSLLKSKQIPFLGVVEPFIFYLPNFQLNYSKNVFMLFVELFELFVGFFVYDCF